MKKIVTYDDISWVVEYEYEENSVNFNAYEIVGFPLNKGGKPDFEKKGTTTGDVTTEDIEEAQTIIRGYIKWDGCSHYYFGDDDGYIHLCGGRLIDKISKGIKKIHKEAGQLMSRADEEEFK